MTDGIRWELGADYSINWLTVDPAQVEQPPRQRTIKKIWSRRPRKGQRHNLGLMSVGS
jgi:hypothetical protein